MKDKTTQCWII